MLPYVLAMGFTLWMAVEAVRRGDTQRWLWIILAFPVIGPGLYFVTEYLNLAAPRFGFRQRRVTPADLRQAESEVRRLDSAATWTEYASMLRSRKENVKAAQAAGKAVERSPHDLDARYELGLALLAASRPGDALPHLEQVVAADRSFDSDDALFALARARQAVGQWPAAREELEELAQRRSRPELLYELAEVQARLGDRPAALRSLQRIVDESELVPSYLKRSVRPWVRRARSALRKLGA